MPLPVDIKINIYGSAVYRELGLDILFPKFSP